MLGGYGNDFINNFISFVGYDFLSFGGNSFVKGGFTMDYEFIPKNHINFTANYANAANDIFLNREWFSRPDYSGYAVGYGMETFMGPIEAKYTWSPEGGTHIWFVSVGFWF